MSSFLAVIHVFTLAAFSIPSTIGATRTMKDVKKCLKENIEDFAKTCEDKLPGKVAEFKKCIAAESEDGMTNSMTACLKEKGVIDDDNCLPPMEELGHQRRDIEMLMFAGMPLPFDIVAKLVPFLECAQAALDKKEDCAEGCPDTRDKVARAIIECESSSLPHPGDVSPLAECIRKISL